MSLISRCKYLSSACICIPGLTEPLWMHVCAKAPQETANVRHNKDQPIILGREWQRKEMQATQKGDSKWRGMKWEVDKAKWWVDSVTGKYSKQRRVEETAWEGGGMKQLYLIFLFPTSIQTVIVWGVGIKLSNLPLFFIMCEVSEVWLHLQIAGLLSPPLLLTQTT